MASLLSNYKHFQVFSDSELARSKRWTTVKHFSLVPKFRFGTMKSRIIKFWRFWRVRKKQLEDLTNLYIKFSHIHLKIVNQYLSSVSIVQISRKIRRVVQRFFGFGLQASATSKKKGKCSTILLVSTSVAELFEPNTRKVLIWWRGVFAIFRFNFSTCVVSYLDGMTNFT